ncbi:uncharacterized protein LOC105200726 [Solenopsis invicta]|uniref:uncharacterized protein LOC105200726 n=1 Tax=Solenopsis invicta TaxID=13686 RepID=UPI00059602EE|nr:uncharacterized protein LOC105200726 [Solenopsis invicta]XP_011166714.1 uncharacterized protein LOC105200726 [Solenopsis invicta]XP_039301942.1 uncharacterized protein LOC105200726 [Solenopsis invicta]
MYNANEQTSRRGFRVSTAVTLRECRVVIIGSRCRICGKDFKCESDVAVHTRWRHNAAGFGSLLDILDHGINLGDIGQKCDMCDMSFGIISDLRIHKRFIHKHRSRQKGRRRREMVRVKFKLNGVTTTDVSLDRRYITLQNNPETERCLVGVYTQTPEPLESEKRQDDCAGNIDLSLPNHVVDKSHMQHGIHKAANRYIVGKFASTKGDATACRAVVVGRSLVEISNTPHKDTVPDSNGSYESYKNHCYLTSQETEADMFIKPFADSIDHDKENAPRANQREKRSVYCQSEISFNNNDTKVYLVCQPEISDNMSPMPKQNSWSNKSLCYSLKSNDVAGTKETAGLANSLIDSREIIINKEKNYGLDGDALLRLSPPLSRLSKKTESMKNNLSVDDDVQEVLRITRGNVQSDINHESPNRMEREILVQNAISDTFTLPPPLQQEPTICQEKCSVAFMNFEPSDYPSFRVITENDYEFVTNSFDKKLGIYLEDLQHYGIRLCNDLPEINNNFEEYSYAHQNVFGTWKYSDELPYGLKANDNEVAVVLD